MAKILFEERETIICKNAKALPGNDARPPLEVDKEYIINKITLDKDGNQHLDVGLISSYNWVTSYETKETLPNSSIGGTHWCHPSRFIKKK